MRARHSWFVIVLMLIASGCTHTQLCRNTLGQMETVHELQQQQVLDNLAMFVCNHNSYPYYSVVTSGQTALTDTGTLTVNNGFGLTSALKFVYNSLGINPQVSRQSQENWQINPVNDSVKLTLMRCVYQRAVGSCYGRTLESPCCPECQKLFEALYGPPPTIEDIHPNEGGANDEVKIFGAHLAGVTEVKFGNAVAPFVTAPTDTDLTVRAPAVSAALGPGTPAPGPTRTPELAPTPELVPTPAPTPGPTPQPTGTEPVTLPVTVPVTVGPSRAWFTYKAGEHKVVRAAAPPGPGASVAASKPVPHVPGIVTPECLAFPPNWFCWGEECHVPKDHRCKLVGHYCGTYVWVPSQHVDELTKLTILIQDIAYYDFPEAGRAPTQYPNTLSQTANQLRIYQLPAAPAVIP